MTVPRSELPLSARLGYVNGLGEQARPNQGVNSGPGGSVGGGGGKSWLAPVPSPFRPNRTTHSMFQPPPSLQPRPPAPYRATTPRVAPVPNVSRGPGRRIGVTIHPGPGPMASNRPVTPGRPTAFSDYTGKSVGSESGHLARVKGFRS